jgi:hypothetical protein
VKHLETEIDIDAGPAVVWEQLTDLESYPEWNPFITEARGTVEAGERLDLRLSPPGGRPIGVKPRVVKAEAGRELRWVGHLGVRGIFDGEHYFVLDQLPDGRTRLRHHGERFTGVTVGLFGGVLKKTEEGFRLLNEALRERSEAAAA